MQRSRAVSNLGVLAIGLIAGCVGTYVFFYVHVNNSYMVQFNSAADAVFVEQTTAMAHRSATKSGWKASYGSRCRGSTRPRNLAVRSVQASKARSNIIAGS
jgi:hypothetical protein